MLEAIGGLFIVLALISLATYLAISDDFDEYI